ncbi:MAG: glycosyltransferase family 4 protein [Polyangiaceae bacterium]|nr:glycosyltransferase family 4 protein [Polyangiaceae bacterium]
MATILLSYLNHTSPHAGGAVHGYHVVEQLRRLGHQLVTAEPRTDDRLARGPRTLRGMRDLLARADAIYMRCDPRPWDEALLLLNRRTRRVPVIVEMNAPENEEALPGSIWRHRPLFLLRTRARGLHYHSIVRLSDAVVCVSSQLADYVRARYPIAPDRVFAVPNGGVPAAELPAARDDGEVRVVWAGGYKWPWQALDTLTEAAARLHAEVPSATVHLYTDAPASAFQGAPGVAVHALVPHAELGRVLASMDAAVCLRRGWTGVYSSPLKLFDFMAAGLPVVATRMGQIVEVVEDGVQGYLVGDDAREVADALIKLARDPARRRAMGRAARDRIAAHYTWDHTGDAIGAVIDRRLR